MAALLRSRAAWWVMVVCAVLIAGFGLTTALAPEARSPVALAQLAHDPLALFLHIFAAVAALLIGPIQFLPRFRDRHRSAHRALGKTYACAVALGGAAALILVPFSFGGAVSAFGFGFLALSWLGATALAVNAIRNGAVAEHRRWMLRSYALTMAGIMLRTYIPISLALGIPFESAYRVIAWLCWVPNLVVVELWLARPVRGLALPLG